MIVSASTLLQINMDPENHRVVDENSLNQRCIFTVHVGLQRGRCISNSAKHPMFWTLPCGGDKGDKMSGGCSHAEDCCVPALSDPVHSLFQELSTPPRCTDIPIDVGWMLHCTG